jgi:hypothetical protein
MPATSISTISTASTLYPPSNNSPSPLAGEPPTLDPLAPLEHLLQSALSAGAAVALGVPLGLLAARLMRHGHLHWSFAASTLAALLALHVPLHGAGLAVGAGAFTAARRGRRWHHEDLDAGADLAEIARQRTTPRDALHAGLLLGRAGLAQLRVSRASASPWLQRVRFAGPRGGAGRPTPTSEPIVGRGRAGRPVSLALGGGATGGAHTLVVGATGAGKTVTQARIATEAIARGMAIIVIDPKGDRALRDALCAAAGAAGAPFLEWTPYGPSIYNPCARGSATEVADRVLAAEHYTEPHYQRQAQRYVNHAVRALQLAGLPVSLAQLVRLLDPQQLEILGRELPEAQARLLHGYLDSLTPRQRTDISGVRDRLAILVESDVGPWLDPRSDASAGRDRSGLSQGSSGGDSSGRRPSHPPSDPPSGGRLDSQSSGESLDGQSSDGQSEAACIDLLAALHQRTVVYFDLRADSRPLLAQMLAAAIVGDLQTAISSLQHNPTSALIVVDEFSALATEHVARLFGRARSAGVSLLLGTQELSDLRVATHPQLLEQVLGNIATLIAHRQAVPDSAELLSRLAGTRGVWRTTWSGADRRTRTRMREPLLDPSVVGRLARGEAAVVHLDGHRGVELAHICTPATQPLHVSPQG